MCVCWGCDGGEEVEDVRPAKSLLQSCRHSVTIAWSSRGKETDDPTDCCVACGH